MDFSLSDEQQLIRDTAKRFAVEKLAPVAAAVDGGEQQEQFLANLKSLAELGFMGLNVDTDNGGAGTDTVSFSLSVTELARECAATAVTVSVTNMVAEIIEAVGSEAQRNRYLPDICSGEFSAGAFCLSEPGAGSDPASMMTKAAKDGDSWIISGTKAWVTSAPYAGVFVVWAVTDPDKPKGKGITCFLVPARTPGVTVASPEHKMGQTGSLTCSVRFEECRVPEEAILGEVNNGFRIAVSELAGGRIGIASLALGLGLSALDYARNYLGERKQFGQKLSAFQGLQWKMAEAYTDLEAARLLIMQAAYQKDLGLNFGAAASMAKLFATEKANQACYTAQQMMGGMGYTKDCPVERMVRDVRVTSIYEGTSEIQRVIIARDLFGDS